jgi:hypothetical protein
LSADIRGSVALFSITDGATGDADGSADGRIVDPSGAVLVSVAPTGVTAVPALTPWALTALSMLLVLAAAFARRRQRR